MVYTFVLSEKSVIREHYQDFKLIDLIGYNYVLSNS